MTTPAAAVLTTLSLFFSANRERKGLEQNPVDCRHFQDRRDFGHAEETGKAAGFGEQTEAASNRVRRVREGRQPGRRS